MSTGRRTWDKEHYEKLAKERAERGDDDTEDHGAKKGNNASSNKEEFRAADSNAAGPMGSQRAFIKSRESRVDLESKVGKVEIINPTLSGDARGAGFWCETCSCLLKDSASYLDHINGKKHQRALGYSMRTERADVSAVKDRLAALKRKVSAVNEPKSAAIDDYEQRLAAQIIEREEAKKRRKEEEDVRKKQEEEEEKRKEQMKTGSNVAVEAEEDDEMAAMMGFGGFGGSKRN